MAGVLFIRSLGGLSKQETARRGNLYGMVGHGPGRGGDGAPAARDQLLDHGRGALDRRRCRARWWPAARGHDRHARAGGDPPLVRGAGGGAGRHQLLPRGRQPARGVRGPLTGAARIIHLVEIWIGIAIGAVTFTGSVIAWGKLRGTISGRPLLLPGRHLLNALIAIGIIGLGVPFVQHTDSPDAFTWLLVMTALAALLGVHLVMAIGGADMPVVVSLLNSYSGWAAAAAGFVLSNDLLIVTGALVGSSGAILSIIMCRAMNRSILNVVFGGFGTADVKGPAKGAAESGGDIRETRRRGPVRVAVQRQAGDHRARLRDGRRPRAERRSRC